MGQAPAGQRLRVLLLLAIILDRGAQCAVASEADWRDSFVLTEQSFPRILKLAATANKEVIYTTFFLGNENIRYMLRNFVYWLQQAGMLQHTLLITQDEGSWRALLEEGMPCFLDRLNPGKEAFANEKARYAQRPFDFSKNFWALKFGELGYASLSVDSDVIVMKDPFPFLEAGAYDLQGLSDYRTDPPELPKLGEILTRRCDLYRIKKAGDSEGGDVLHPSWELQGEELEGSMRALTPCLSLGVLHIRPTPASMSFLRGIMDWLMHTHLEQWDQAAWNEVLMGYVVGMGEYDPLKFRLLPLEHFSNIEVWEARKEQRLPVDPAILHAGFIEGGLKAERMKSLNFWKPDDFNREASLADLQIFNGSSNGSILGSMGQAPIGSLATTRTVLLMTALIAGLVWCMRRRRRPPFRHDGQDS